MVLSTSREYVLLKEFYEMIEKHRNTWDCDDEDDGWKPDFTLFEIENLKNIRALYKENKRKFPKVISDEYDFACAQEQYVIEYYAFVRELGHYVSRVVMKGIKDHLVSFAYNWKTYEYYVKEAEFIISHGLAIPKEFEDAIKNKYSSILKTLHKIHFVNI